MKPRDPLEIGGAIGMACIGAAIGLLIALLAGALTGCAGSTMRMEYGQPDGKAVAFELKLPTKYAK